MVVRLSGFYRVPKFSRMVNDAGFHDHSYLHILVAVPIVGRICLVFHLEITNVNLDGRATVKVTELALRSL